MVRHGTEVIDRLQIAGFRYRKMHTINEVSEATIMHFMDKPVVVEVQVIQKVTAGDELTQISASASISAKGSFATKMEERD